MAEHRYVLFVGNDFSKEGGQSDYMGSFSTVEAAMSSLDAGSYDAWGDWAHVFDAETETIVKHFREGAWTDIVPQ